MSLGAAETFGIALMAMWGTAGAVALGRSAAKSPAARELAAAVRTIRWIGSSVPWGTTNFTVSCVNLGERVSKEVWVTFGDHTTPQTTLSAPGTEPDMGHVGIVDYDGYGIAAGQKEVNRRYYLFLDGSCGYNKHGVSP